MKGTMTAAVAATPTVAVVVKTKIGFKDVGKVLQEQRRKIGLNQAALSLIHI